jgi:flagellin
MTISIPSSTPSLSALETLALLQQGASANAGSASTTVSATSPAGAADSGAAAIVDVNGGASAAASLSGMSGIIGSASTADLAVTAGGAVQSLLAQMRQDAVSASDPTLGADSRAALDSGFQSDLAQISQTVAGASFNGVNLLDGSTANAGADGAALNGIDLTPTGSLIGLPAGASLSDPSSAAAIASQLGTAIDNVGQAVGQIAAQGQAIATHLSVVAQAGLSLQPSLGSQVNGGLDADGARLAALQVQQSLASTGSSVASQAPQAMLALFR